MSSDKGEMMDLDRSREYIFQRKALGWVENLNGWFTLEEGEK